MRNDDCELVGPCYSEPIRNANMNAHIVSSTFDFLTSVATDLFRQVGSWIGGDVRTFSRNLKTVTHAQVHTLTSVSNFRLFQACVDYTTNWRLDCWVCACG